MRIGLDYLPAVTHAPGIGRYARELVRALVLLPECPELRLLQLGGARPTIGEPALGLSAADGRVKRRRLRAPRRWLDTASRTVGLSADRLLGGVDLFHRIHADWPPVKRARTVLAVSELPPPGSPGEVALREAYARIDHFVVFSRIGAELLQQRFEIDEACIHRAPVGCEHWSREIPEAPPRETEPPYAVVLGGVRRERRHAAIAQAFEHLWRDETCGRIYFLGAPGDGADALEARLAQLESRVQVRWLPRPKEGQMPLLVARASVLIHLAESELTPVTPLEAFASGTPVVASRLPAFEEGLEGEAVLVDNAALDEDPKVLAAAVKRAIESLGDSAAEARRRTIAARHTWERNARETIAIWSRVLES